MITFEADTFDDLQRGICGELLNNPTFVEGVKGKRIHEALSVTMRLRDPRGRITTSPTRAMNYGPLVASFVRSMTMDVKAAEQRRAIITALTADPHTREAVVSEKGFGSMQFFIRNQRLHLHASVAALDAIWSLTSMVFAMTMVQELILLELREASPKLDLGDTVITTGSLVLYERHFELGAVLESEEERPPARMLPLTRREDLDAVAYDEAALREGRLVSKGEYDGAAAWMFDQLLHYRLYRDDAMKWPKRALKLAN